MIKDHVPNQLIHESSPYLLQHAYNPVSWYAWNETSLSKAVEENKPILLSIGYSACHWCHVMERESFENKAIAEQMNKHFICIKVDREERPDIDQIYMDSVQAMGVSGGWPLNVFLTPEQKPFYGGTYYPPVSWQKILDSIVDAFESNREEINLSAERLSNHLSQSDIRKYNLSPDINSFNISDLSQAILHLKDKFDPVWGGISKAPKFPMPSIWQFLFRAASITGSVEIEKHVVFTLNKIAAGGIYDHIGGGFARYSVDERWFLPHFEKMLYDNGQLISLFAEVGTKTKNPFFREIVEQTIEFAGRELLGPENGYYCALDADSEGVEGKYYTWSANEFRTIVDNHENLWLEYFNISEAGNWENGLNIPFRNAEEEVIALKYNLTSADLKKNKQKVQHDLLEVRLKRIPPGLDNKILASWNAMMLQGLIDAYNAYGVEKYLDLALRNSEYLSKYHSDGKRVFRTSNSNSNPINGFLEDYAFIIQSFISLYQATFDEKWLKKSAILMQYVLANFYDKEEDFFYFTDQNSPSLVVAKKEVFDNVVPSSNSVMAMNLYKLGILYDNNDYLQKASLMVSRISKFLFSDPEYLSNWGSVFLMLSKPVLEIVISGEKALEFRKELASMHIPGSFLMGTVGSSDLPILEGRTHQKQTTIFICYDKSCKLPVHTVQEAIAQIKNN